jgi:hypothetical protein
LPYGGWSSRAIRVAASASWRWAGAAGRNGTATTTRATPTVVKTGGHGNVYRTTTLANRRETVRGSATVATWRWATATATAAAAAAATTETFLWVLWENFKRGRLDLNWGLWHVFQLCSGIYGREYIVIRNRNEAAAIFVRDVDDGRGGRDRRDEEIVEGRGGRERRRRCCHDGDS